MRFSDQTPAELRALVEKTMALNARHRPGKPSLVCIRSGDGETEVEFTLGSAELVAKLAGELELLGYRMKVSEDDSACGYVFQMGAEQDGFSDSGITPL